MTTYLYNQPNLTAGLDEALTSTAQSVPMFPIMLLVFVYFIIILGGGASQKRRTGSADIPFWAVLAGTACTFLSLIMTMSKGLIDITTLGIVIAITVMSGLWFFLSNRREQ